VSPLQLAQVNIGRALAPLTDNVMQGFVTQLDAVNALAEQAPGFVWRLKDDAGASSSYIQAFDDPLVLVNLSVWESIEALEDFTYHTLHAAVLRDRARWFERSARASLALWWIPRGHLPTVEEAKQRLARLWEHGASPAAFTFRERFPPVSGDPSPPAAAAAPGRRD